MTGGSTMPGTAALDNKQIAAAQSRASSGGLVAGARVTVVVQAGFGGSLAGAPTGTQRAPLDTVWVPSESGKLTSQRLGERLITWRRL